MSMRAPKLTFIIHRTGRITVLGGDVRRVNYGAKKFSKMMEKIGYKPQPTPVDIRNMVFSGQFPTKLDPFELKALHPLSIQYEPELFPGIHYLLKDTKTCITMFVNGKFYITGVKTAKDAQELVDSFYMELLLSRN